MTFHYSRLINNYNVIKNFGVFAKNIMEDFIKVILFFGLLFIIFLNLINKSFSHDLAFPFIPIDRLHYCSMYFGDVINLFSIEIEEGSKLCQVNFRWS